jgi:tripartite-type tricarboxylate transporter receptor subunit TctC
MLKGDQIMSISRRNTLKLAGLTLAGLGGLSRVARAQSYPSNIIRIVVPTGPGTPPDIISRVIAAEISSAEDWRVVIDNRPGAFQTIGIAEVLKQPADGLTLYPMSVPTAAVPALMPKLGLRPDADFAPVIKVSKSYNVLLVPPSFPVHSVKELVAELKKAPGRYNYSSYGAGTPAHLIGEMFKLRTGANATHVPYQQQSQRVADLINGTNQFDFLPTITAAEFAMAGKLRAIAVTSPERVPSLPDVPTVVEQGFPDLVTEDFIGFSVKSGTPNDIVARLNQATNKALAAPKVRETFAKLGAVPGGGTPGEFGEFVRSQVVYWRTVVTDAGIKPLD